MMSILPKHFLLALLFAILAGTAMPSAAQDNVTAEEDPTDQVSGDELLNQATTALASADEALRQATQAVQKATQAAAAQKKASSAKFNALIAGLSIFVLAVFVGFEVITKVPPTLHTPLMSGSNAISGITLVGALLVAGRNDYASLLGVLAVVFAMINVIGGFWVTHRMLSMFKR